MVATNQPRDHRPAVAGAPHRDADGRGLAASWTVRGVGGHGDGLLGSGAARRMVAATLDPSLRGRRANDDPGPACHRGRRAAHAPPPRDRYVRIGAIGSNGSIVSVARTDLAGDPPRPGEHAIEQEGAHRRAVARRQRDGPAGRDDPRPIGVAEQDVVVLGQEARRGRRVRVRAAARRAGRPAPCRARRGTSASCGRSRSTTAPRPVSPDHARTSGTVAGPNAAR